MHTEITNSAIQKSANIDMSLFHLIASADIVSQIVMLTLFLASVLSWAIIYSKLISYKKTKSKMSAFEGVFWSGQILDTLYDRMKRSTDNPLAVIFVTAMNECKRQDITSLYTQSSFKIGLKERIMQTMHLVRNRELDMLERNLNILAIIGSCSLFIGLFGTVWGIINSFQAIATMKTAGLDVVAPGIAEALLATAIGLIAAIPASVAYNLFVAEINKFNGRMDDFIGELYTILARTIDEEKL